MDNKEKILLADDYIDVFADLKTILIKKGYEVHSEMNKIESIEKLPSAKPDLAISDIMANKNYEGFKLNQQILKSSKNLLKHE